MATKAELTKKVDDLTASTTTARTAWKEAIPGPDDPKMTDEEQAEVDKLEAVYTAAKAARGTAETELANWTEAQRIAASAGTPVNTPAPAVDNDGISDDDLYYLGYI
tara:strand:- start:1186 stop:1506 length:321 start_codon:yes stop_codon:yes gene_type:complete